MRCRLYQCCHICEACPADSRLASIMARAQSMRTSLWTVRKLCAAGRLHCAVLDSHTGGEGGRK